MTREAEYTICWAGWGGCNLLVLARRKGVLIVRRVGSLDACMYVFLPFTHLAYVCPVLMHVRRRFGYCLYCVAYVYVTTLSTITLANCHLLRRPIAVCRFSVDLSIYQTTISTTRYLINYMLLLILGTLPSPHHLHTHTHPHRHPQTHRHTRFQLFDVTFRWDETR